MLTFLFFYIFAHFLDFVISFLYPLNRSVRMCDNDLVRWYRMLTGSVLATIYIHSPLKLFVSSVFFFLHLTLCKEAPLNKLQTCLGHQWNIQQKQQKSKKEKRSSRWIWIYILCAVLCCVVFLFPFFFLSFLRYKSDVFLFHIYFFFIWLNSSWLNGIVKKNYLVVKKK